MNKKDEILSKISSFPTLPVMAQKLLALLEDPDSGTAEIGKVLQYDPALTANVLKAANSAFLGFSEPVNSLSEASYRIGTKWIMQIALSSLIYSNLHSPAKGYEMTASDLWKHSIAVALMSENLCKLLGIKDGGMIYTAALIHDIGKLVLENAVDENFDNIKDTISSENASFEEAEQEVVGLNHAEAGALIAESWSFPKSIIEIIRCHHNPQEAEEITTALDVVHIADAVCLMQGIGLGRDGLQYRCNEGSLKRLDVTSNIIEKATSQLIDRLESIEHMFSETPKPDPVGR